MGTGIFITGTDTGVGKTVVTAGLMSAMRSAGIDAAAFKPVQSGARRGGADIFSQDAAFFLKTAGLAEDIQEYNLYRFEQPYSPHLAAEMSGSAVLKEAVLDRCRELQRRHQVLLVEGAGGICVPLDRSVYTVAHLARDIGFPLLVVARPGLGTINHTVLTISYARAAGIRVAGFIFNRSREEEGVPEDDNAGMITAMTGAPLMGRLPYIKGLDVDEGLTGNLAEEAGRHILWKEIREAI